VEEVEPEKQCELNRSIVIFFFNRNEKKTVPPLPPMGKASNQIKRNIMPLKPLSADMRKFKIFFHPDRPTCFQLFSKDKQRGKESEYFFRKWTTNVRDRLIRANLSKMEIGMTINRIDGKGRRAENVTDIVAVFVDCDGGKPTKLLRPSAFSAQ
jgi:hypothetical protein